MKLTSMTDHRPYMNVVFGNFYSPAYDDENFIDETMGLIKELGFNSVMFDTKAWEDFKERCETGALSQYVKMQEYMARSATAHGLSYNFLLLYMNGDNLYPHIRFSPPDLWRRDGTYGRNAGEMVQILVASFPAVHERTCRAYLRPLRGCM